MRTTGYEAAPMVLAFVLGRLAEESLRQSSSERRRVTEMGAPKWPPTPQTFGAPRQSRGAPLRPP